MKLSSVNCATKAEKVFIRRLKGKVFLLIILKYNLLEKYIINYLNTHQVSRNVLNILRKIQFIST